MKQETNNKFAAILAAAQAKANIQPTFISPAPVPEKQPEPIQPEPETTQPEQVQQQPDAIPELSTMTIESLLNEDRQQVCSPSFFSMIKAYPLPVEETKPTLQIVDYSERSFAIVTTVKPSDDILNILRQHGTFNQFLKCGKGWIFSKRHLATIKEKLGL